jgi:hypothetical protein
MSLCKHEGEYPGRNRQADRQLAGGQCVPSEAKAGVKISVVVRLPSGRLYGGQIIHSGFHSHKICFVLWHVSVSIPWLGCPQMQMAMVILMFRLLYLHIFLDFRGCLKYQGDGRVLIMPVLMGNFLSSDSVCELPEKLHRYIAAQSTVNLQIIAR